MAFSMDSSSLLVENQQLKERVRQLEVEREILKKALAYASVHKGVLGYNPCEANYLPKVVVFSGNILNVLNKLAIFQSAAKNAHFRRAVLFGFDFLFKIG